MDAPAPIESSHETPPWWLRFATGTGAVVLGVIGFFVGMIAAAAVAILITVLLPGQLPPLLDAIVAVASLVGGGALGVYGASRLARILHRRQQALLDEIPERPRLTGAVGGDATSVGATVHVDSR